MQDVNYFLEIWGHAQDQVQKMDACTKAQLVRDAFLRHSSGKKKKKSKKKHRKDDERPMVIIPDKNALDEIKKSPTFTPSCFLPLVPSMYNSDSIGLDLGFGTSPPTHNVNTSANKTPMKKKGFFSVLVPEENATRKPKRKPNKSPKAIPHREEEQSGLPQNSVTIPRDQSDLGEMEAQSASFIQGTPDFNSKTVEDQPGGFKDGAGVKDTLEPELAKKPTSRNRGGINASDISIGSPGRVSPARDHHAIDLDPNILKKRATSSKSVEINKLSASNISSDVSSIKDFTTLPSISSRDMSPVVVLRDFMKMRGFHVGETSGGSKKVCDKPEDSNKGELRRDLDVANSREKTKSKSKDSKILSNSGVELRKPQELVGKFCLVDEAVTANQRKRHRNEIESLGTESSKIKRKRLESPPADEAMKIDANSSIIEHSKKKKKSKRDDELSTKLSTLLSCLADVLAMKTKDGSKTKKKSKKVLRESRVLLDDLLKKKSKTKASKSVLIEIAKMEEVLEKVPGQEPLESNNKGRDKTLEKKEGASRYMSEHNNALKRHKKSRGEVTGKRHEKKRPKMPSAGYLRGNGSFSTVSSGIEEKGSTHETEKLGVSLDTAKEQNDVVDALPSTGMSKQDMATQKPSRLFSKGFCLISSTEKGDDCQMESLDKTDTAQGMQKVNNDNSTKETQKVSRPKRSRRCSNTKDSDENTSLLTSTELGKAPKSKEFVSDSDSDLEEEGKEDKTRPEKRLLPGVELSDTTDIAQHMQHLNHDNSIRETPRVFRAKQRRCSNIKDLNENTSLSTSTETAKTPKSKEFVSDSDSDLGEEDKENKTRLEKRPVPNKPNTAQCMQDLNNDNSIREIPRVLRTKRSRRSSDIKNLNENTSLSNSTETGKTPKSKEFVSDSDSDSEDEVKEKKTRLGIEPVADNIEETFEKAELNLAFNKSEHVSPDNPIFDCRVDGTTLAEQWDEYVANNPNEGTPMEDAYFSIFWNYRNPRALVDRDYRPSMEKVYNYILDHDFPIPELNAKRLEYSKVEGGLTSHITSQEASILLKKFPRFRKGSFNPEEKDLLIRNLKRFFSQDMRYTSPEQCANLMQEMMGVRCATLQHHIRLYFASFIAGPKMLEYRLAADIFHQIENLCMGGSKNKSRSKKAQGKDQTRKNTRNHYSLMESCIVIDALFDNVIKKYGSLPKDHDKIIGEMTKTEWESLEKRTGRNQNSLRCHWGRSLLPILKTMALGKKLWLIESPSFSSWKNYL